MRSFRSRFLIIWVLTDMFVNDRASDVLQEQSSLEITDVNIKLAIKKLIFSCEIQSWISHTSVAVIFFLTYTHTHTHIHCHPEANESPSLLYSCQHRLASCWPFLSAPTPTPAHQHIEESTYTIIQSHSSNLYRDTKSPCLCSSMVSTCLLYII